jgi:hypothetical protein
MRTTTQPDWLSKLKPPSRPGLFLASMPLVLAMTLWWPFAGVHQVVMTPGASDPSARGIVYITQDRNNNTKLDLKVRYLSHPSSLVPSEIVYVVWIQQKGRSAEDQG